MSGITDASAAGGDVIAPPPPPLSAGVGFSGGDGPFYVSGASGNLIDNYSPPAAFVYSTTGGTPPYVGIKSILGDPSGKLSIVSSGGHDTLAWSGFILNELETCYLQFDVTDNVGATASARYPLSLYAAIKRTS